MSVIACPCTKDCPDRGEYCKTCERGKEYRNEYIKHHGHKTADQTYNEYIYQVGYRKAIQRGRWWRNSKSK